MEESESENAKWEKSLGRSVTEQFMRKKTRQIRVTVGRKTITVKDQRDGEQGILGAVVVFFTGAAHSEDPRRNFRLQVFVAPTF